MFWRHERYGTKTSRGGVHKKACHRLISSTGFAPWACSARRPRKGIRKLRLSSPTCFAVEKLASRTRKKRRGLWLRYGTVHAPGSSVSQPSRCTTSSPQASATGNPEAKFNTAVAKLLGDGVQRDVRGAVAILEQLGKLQDERGARSNELLTGIYNGDAGLPAGSHPLDPDKAFEAASRTPPAFKAMYVKAQMIMGGMIQNHEISRCSGASQLHA